MGVVFEFYGKLQNEESARTAGGFNIRMGLAFAAVAAVIGFLGVIGIGDIFSEADPRLSLEVKTRMRKFLSYHILFACSTVVTTWCVRPSTKNPAWCNNQNVTCDSKQNWQPLDSRRDCLALLQSQRRRRLLLGGGAATTFQ